MMKKLIPIFIFLISIISSYSLAEGTKQLRPQETDFGYINLMDQQNNLGTERTFALYNATDDTRLNIHIANPDDEVIYFGVKTVSTDDLYFRFKDPNGNIIYPETLVPQTDGQTGKIIDYNEAVTGPAPLMAGGYTPFVITPTAGLAGDYSIEFYDPMHNPPSNYAKRQLELFDITVADINTNKAIEGRLWSKAWDITTTALTNGFNGSTYIYTNDGITTEAKFTDFEAWSFIIQSNSTGPNSAGDVTSNRQSIDGGILLPEYKIFLNKPDTLVFPVSAAPEIVGSPNIDLCTPSASYCIDIETSNPGVIEYIIDLAGSVGFDHPRDRKLIADVSGGLACLPWDGLDGLGMPLTLLDTFDIILSYQAGVTHLFIHDAENNPSGFNVNHVYPDNGLGKPLMYFDDTDPAVGGSSDLIGCNNDCHSWTGNYGNNKTINTWWVTFFENDTIHDISLNRPTLKASLDIQEDQAVNCVGNDLALSISNVTQEGASPTYSWYLNGSLETSATTYTPSSLQQDDSIAVVLLPSELCIEADTAYFIVNLPSYSLSVNDDQICSGDTATLLTTSSSPNLPLTYQWTGYSFTTATIKTNPTVTTIYEVISTDSEGCKDTATSTVTVYDKPLITANNAAICQNDSALINSIVSGGDGNYSYLWTPALGLTSSSSTSTMASPNITSIYQIIVEDGNTCKDTVDFTVTVFDLPTLSVNSGSICNGDSLLLQTSVSSGTVPYTYDWPNSADLQTNLASALAFPQANSTYQIIVSDANTCKDTATATVNVFSKPTISLNGASICEGASTTLITGVSNASGTVLYSWSPAMGLSSTTISSPVANPTTSSNYQVIIEDANTCKDTAVVTVDVIAMPNAMSFNVDTTICPNETVNLDAFEDLTENYTFEWQYSSNGSSFSTFDNRKSTIVSNEGYYQVVVKNQNRCPQTSSPIRVQVENLNLQALSDVSEAYVDDVVFLSASTSPSIVSLSWEVGNTNINQQSFSHNLQADTWFTAIGQGAQCEVRDSVLVTVLYPVIPPPPIVIPNGFSPNGDGKNDYWFIKGLPFYDNVELTIYNRWGSIVYQHFGQYTSPWPGINQNGDSLPDATYYYVISANGEHSFEYKGNVTIIR